jgi:hypothetical protein
VNEVWIIRSEFAQTLGRVGSMLGEGADGRAERAERAEPL